MNIQDTHKASTLNTKDFDFVLPQELIAQQPLTQRSQSRLLKSTNINQHLIEDNIFSNILDLVPDNSVFIINTSKVIKARVIAKTEHGGKIEIFLLNPCPEDSTWNILAKPEKKLRLGKKIYFNDGTIASVIRTRTDSENTAIKFDMRHDQIYKWMDINGQIPLPPYIKRNHDRDDLKKLDEKRYQTVYSAQPGSVAAPTAGLHFTPAIIEAAKTKNIQFIPVCLHVGLGTFLPVNCEHPKDHTMHFENYQISKDSLAKIIEAKKNNRPIFSVGSTSFRCVESFFQTNSLDLNTDDYADEIHSTNLFIYPENSQICYKPKIFDGMITNFHLPKSTLYMLICGLLGQKRAADIYRHAIENKYRFFSYGDCSLLIF